MDRNQENGAFEFMMPGHQPSCFIVNILH